MSKSNTDLDFSFIDSVGDFLDNEAPTEKSLLISQSTRQNHANPIWREQWLAKNNEAQQDPERQKKLSASLKKWHAENPDAMQKRVNTPEARANHKKAVEEYVNSPDYVNPRGMLGKKRTEEAKQKSSIALSGKEKPLEGNKKISEFYKGKKKDPKVVAKVSKTLSGRTHNRTRGINTPVKNFIKIGDAASYFDVSPVSIKNWCNNKGTTMTNKKVIKKLTDKGIKFNENNYPIGFEWAEGRENLGAKKVQTPDGIFKSTKEASKHYKISENGLRTRCNNDKWPDFYFLDEKSEFKSSQINKPLT